MTVCNMNDVACRDTSPQLYQMFQSVQDYCFVFPALSFTVLDHSRCSHQPHFQQQQKAAVSREKSSDKSRLRYVPGSEQQS